MPVGWSRECLVIVPSGLVVGHATHPRRVERKPHEGWHMFALLHSANHSTWTAHIAWTPRAKTPKPTPERTRQQGAAMFLAASSRNAAVALGSIARSCLRAAQRVATRQRRRHFTTSAWASELARLAPNASAPCANRFATRHHAAKSSVVSNWYRSPLRAAETRKCLAVGARDARRGEPDEG
jgi:hypothetical protein